MRIVHRGRHGLREVHVDIDDPSRPVGDLLSALDPHLDAAIEPVIDGAPVTTDSPLSAVTICEGSIVDTTVGPATTKAPVRTVAVVGGIRAGVVVGGDDPLTIGRGDDVDVALDDPALSARHLEFRGAIVADLGSRNGVAIDGHRVMGSARVADGAVVRAGLSRFRAEAHVEDRPVAVANALGARGGTIPFNRPPRIEPHSTPPSLSCTGPDPVAPASEPLSLAGIVLPIVAGAIVAVLFSPFMAVFAALGPVLTIGTWWERRRRSRRNHANAVAEHDAAVAAVLERLPHDRRREIARRRNLHPDPAEVVRRARCPSVKLWERRVGHADAFVVAVGAADEPFLPVLVAANGESPASEICAFVGGVAAMPDVPLPIDLSAGHVVGVVGDRAAALSLARALVLQMTTHHGPADLSLVIGADAPLEWHWTTWLPHTADHASGRRGVAVLETGDVAGADAVLSGAEGRTVLAVLDGEDPFQGRTTVGRRLLASGSVAAVVMVRDEHRLPARCDTVVRVDALGRITIVDTRRADPGRTGLGWGIGDRVATEAARRLARLDDPELPVVGAGVPAAAPLLGLLGLSGDDVGEIESRWSLVDGSARLAVPIGADGEGPVVLDFVADGPHLLIGGTTGSGKSELLRSMVAGIAATADPDHVSMVLVDYKGGAAFDCCAELPHVAGLVTDLDADLAARALRCLEAELRHRERRLREVGADDLASFRAQTVGGPPAEPLPRLLVVVDEFASLAADLPDFVHSLVGVAQRGRSLGVHMVLATQRPAGVVTDDIRANTGCRIALRVTDRNDSADVIDAPDAALIPRSLPGRAVARFGPGELVPFQAAQVTSRSSSSTGVRVRGLQTPATPAGETEATDLQRLVAIVRAAHVARGGRPPRSPWPPQLPDDLWRVEVSCPSTDWYLVDEPDEQRQRFDGWTPDDGHLVVVGAPGAGSTTTLAAAALAATSSHSAECPHLHVIDLDAGRLLALADLSAAGTVVGPSDRERRGRLLRWLDEEIARRRADTSVVAPRLLLVVDDLGGLARAHDLVREPAIHERFARVWADGPAVGVVVAVSVRRAADLAPALAATAGTVLVHRTADQSDGLRFGVKASTERLPPGRAVRAADGATVHVMRDADTVVGAVATRPRRAAMAPTPHEVGELPPEIRWDAATPSVDVSAAGVDIRIVVRDRDLGEGVLRLHPGEHAVVLGPPRSGRTSALATMAGAAGDHAIVVGEELSERSGIDPTRPEALAAAVAGRGPTLVLIDDVLAIEDPTGALAQLVESSSAGLHFVVSAHADRYRSAYGHWAADIKTSRAGLLLRPDPLDGDLLGQQFPGRLDLPPFPGRGVLVCDATTEVVQVVLPPGQSTS